MIIKNIKTAFLKAALILCALYSGQLGANTWLNLDEDESYTARHEASFVQAGNRFYLFGGRENPRTLDTYDYAQDEWTTAASAPIEFNHFQAIEYQGLIWVIGAFSDNGFPNESPAEHIYIYDPANDVWNQGPEIPIDRRRGSAGLVEYQGKFYVVGGNTIGHNGGYVPWFDVYDPQTGSWTALQDAPNARDHFHATVANNKLYAAGGRLSGGAGGTFAPTIAQVDVYDFAAGTWSSLPSSGDLPTPRAGTSTVTFQGNVVVIGGEGDGQAYRTVEQLDPNTNLWTEIASMNHARHGTQAIVSGNGIFTALGSPRQGGGRQHNMEAFNSSTPSGIASSAAAVAFDLDEVVLTSTDVVDVSLNHTNGNQGALLTSISLVGNNASSFMLSNQNVLPNLLAVDTSKTISIRAGANVDGDFSSLQVTYDDGEKVSIPVRAQFQNSVPQDPENLIQNGSFESVSFGDADTQISSGLIAWQKNGNGNVEFWRSGFQGQLAQDGNALLALDVDESTIDSLEQQITTETGRAYELSLNLRAAPNSSAATNALVVLWNGSQVGSFTGGSGWQTHTINVVGTGFDSLSLAETALSNDGTGTHIDNIRLVEASEPQTTTTNLSLGRIATQSSTSHNGVASRAVDGDTNGTYRDQSVTHTSNSNQPWWQVDLGQNALVDSVELFNRTDSCCTSRLSNFYLMISPEPFANRSLDELLSDTSIARSFHTSLSTSSINVNFNDAPGRYVRVQLQDANVVLSLAEVQVVGRISDDEEEPAISNLSLGQPSQQSSTSHSGVASRAVDGNTNGVYSVQSVTHTNASSNQAWWQVDLGDQALVDNIVLFNRSDACCTSRLSNFYVMVSPQPFGSRSLSELLNDQSIQRSFHSSLSSNSIEIDFNNAQGQYVRIQLQNSGVLSLAEVEVMGHFSDGEPAVISNLSIGKAVAQHSTGFNGSASRAVDGNPNGQYFNGSVTHTNTAFQTWWQVDLAAQSLIESVVIHNRTDCCTSRLANFYVLLSAEPFGSRSLNELLSDSSIQSRFESNLSASSIEVDFNNAQGRYVRVQLTNTNPLSLAEVEVMGSVQ